MQNKKLWLATTAIALLGSIPQAQADGLYVSVFGGANFVAEESAAVDVGPGSTTETFSSDPDTGFVIGGVIGTHLDKWAKGLRTEIEVAYRRNDVGGTWFDGDGSSSFEAGFIDANVSTFTIMANAWYDINIGSKVVPYVGGGVGWARSQAKVAFIETTPTSGDFDTDVIENSGFAWQLGLGFNYEVAPDVDVGIGYRYLVTPKFAEFLLVNTDGDHDNVQNHAVQINLTVGIN